MFSTPILFILNDFWMKKIALLVLLGLSMVACHTRGFRIAGFYDGSQNDKVVLLTEVDGRVDTLLSCDVVNGRFELVGRMDTETVVRLGIAKEWGDLIKAGNSFFLDNRNYMAYLSSREDQCEIIENSDAQIFASAFYRNEKRLMDRKELLFKAYLEGTETERDTIGLQFRKLVEDYETKETKLIEVRSDSYVSAAAIARSVVNYEQRIRQFDYALGLKVSSLELEIVGWEMIKKRYGLLGEQAKTWFHKKGFEERLARVEDKMWMIRQAVVTSEGRMAPDFTLKTPEGDSFSLYRVKSKLKLIDFWASYCGPCRVENAHVAALYHEFHAKGFEVISISSDTRVKDWMKAIVEDRLIWKYHGMISSGEESVARVYGVSLIPCTILVDEDNRIIARNWGMERLKQKIMEYLK